MLDSLYDECLSEAYTGGGIIVSEDKLTIKGFSVQSVFNIPTLFVTAVVPDDVYAKLQSEEEVYQIVKMEDKKSQFELS